MTNFASRCAAIVSLIAGTDGAGNARVTLPIPPLPMLAGLPMLAQAFVLDPLGSALGLAFTNASLQVVGE